MNPVADRHIRPWSSERLELGEGARWIDGHLHLVDLLAGRLLVADLQSVPGLREVLRVAGPLGAVAARAGHVGSWIAAMGPGIALIEIGRGPEWLARPEDGNAASVRMNDGAVDLHGRFWAGSMADDGSVGHGSLYRMDHDGRVDRVLDGLSIANGPVFSPDGRSMFLADSAVGTIDRFPIGEQGELGQRETFTQIAADDGQPDGMTVDVEGGVWVAVWGSGSVRRYRPNGSLDRTLRLGARQPTSVCLGGTDGRDLFITSASVGLGHVGSADGAVFRTSVDVPAPPAPPARLD